MTTARRFTKWDVYDHVNRTNSLVILAHYVLCIGRNTRRERDLTSLELELEKAAFLWLKRRPKSVDSDQSKKARVLALPDDELLEVVRNARAKGVELSAEIEKAELAAFNRSKLI